MDKKVTIAIHGLSYSINSQYILRNMSTMLPAASFTALVGPNGAGKSTLLQMIAGLATPTTGEVSLVPGGPCHAMDPLQRAGYLSWTPPMGDLPFSLSCFDLVMLGRFANHRGRPSAQDQQTVDWALDQLGISSFHDRTLHSMSSGEQQKAAIARGIASQAPVLLFDEPTANLDIQASINAFTLMKSLANEGHTVVAATHDLAQARQYADHFVALRSGELVNSGAIEGLTPQVIQDTFDVKVRSVVADDGRTGFIFG